MILNVTSMRFTQISKNGLETGWKTYSSQHACRQYYLDKSTNNESTDNGLKSKIAAAAATEFIGTQCEWRKVCTCKHFTQRLFECTD